MRKSSPSTGQGKKLLGFHPKDQQVIVFERKNASPLDKRRLSRSVTPPWVVNRVPTVNVSLFVLHPSRGERSPNRHQTRAPDRGSCERNAARRQIPGTAVQRRESRSFIRSLACLLPRWSLGRSAARSLTPGLPSFSPPLFSHVDLRSQKRTGAGGSIL